MWSTYLCLLEDMGVVHVKFPRDGLDQPCFAYGDDRKPSTQHPQLLDGPGHVILTHVLTRLPAGGQDTLTQLNKRHQPCTA